MKLKNLFLLAAASLMIISCSENDDFANGNNQNTLSAIQSGNNKFSTRFNSLTGKWESGDAIGVYMLDESNTTPVNDGANIEFITQQEDATVKFTANPGIEIADQTVNFYSYYPYNADISADFMYTIDLSDQSTGYASYDLMWAKKTGATKADMEANGLSLTFEHKLVFLVVNIASFPDGITSLTEVLAGGINTAATFNLVTGELNLGDAVKTLKLYKIADNKYGAIILPTSTPGAITLTFMAEGRKFQYTVPSSIVSFNSGSKYVFNISLGTSNAQGSITEIEGGSTPWDGEEEGKDGTGTEVVNNPNIPADYTSVSVTAENFANVLNGVAGKVALVFSTGITYPVVETMAVPESVSELLLISEGNTQVELPLQEITYKNLGKVVLNNLKIKGSAEKDFLANKTDGEFTGDAVIEIKNCNFSTMKAVYGNSGGAQTLTSYIIDNCQMSHMESLINKHRTNYIKVTNSTLYKITERTIYLETSGAASPTIIVEDCTLADLTLTPIETTGASGNMTYKNNISACFQENYQNLAYRVTPVEFSANYAAAGEGAAINVHSKPVTIEGAWVSTEMTVDQLFADAANGDFTTTVPAGDPRWR